MLLGELSGLFVGRLDGVAISLLHHGEVQMMGISTGNDIDFPVIDRRYPYDRRIVWSLLI